jgi:hypothetical protein
MSRRALTTAAFIVPKSHSVGAAQLGAAQPPIGAFGWSPDHAKPEKRQLRSRAGFGAAPAATAESRSCEWDFFLSAAFFALSRIQCGGSDPRSLRFHVPPLTPPTASRDSGSTIYTAHFCCRSEVSLKSGLLRNQALSCLAMPLLSDRAVPLTTSGKATAIRICPITGASRIETDRVCRRDLAAFVTS